MNRSGIALLFSSLFVLLLSSCTNPPDLKADPPPVSIEEPNIFAQAPPPSRSLATVDDALACLASHRPAYGITTANTNLRSTPSVETCRIGRIPVGTTVKIDRAYDSSGNPILRSTVGFVDRADSTAIGYQEDIYPIFDRTCNSCHSGIVKNAGLQVTAYDALMTGSDKGPVVIPDDSAGSLLWLMIDSGRMPMVGELSAADKETVRRWIDAGAPERRPLSQSSSNIWLNLVDPEVQTVPDGCDPADIGDLRLVSSDLIEPLSCGAPPLTSTLQTSLASVRSGSGPSVGATSDSSATRPQGVAALAVPYASGADAGRAGIQVTTLGLPLPSDADLWLETRGGFCIERRLPQNERSITALAFAPDGRLYLALDTPPLAEADPLILYDAYHPSRSIAVYDSVNDSGFQEIFQESPRITGLDYENGSLYVSRSGEVGHIPDGGEYRPLAGGFAVNSQLFHANNGIEVSDGWVYVSSGGIRDGYSDGPLVDIGEAGAQSIVAGGNAYAARIVRAPLDRLLSERSIATFETAARGVRNPYGIARDPAGRIWFTDNGATNVPDEISAGDEVNIFDPRSATGNDATAPYYGFPLALSGSPPDWYTDPAIGLPNASAPTGITWAYNTIFYAQYGRNPGLYRMGKAPNGQLASERILLIWPLLAVETAPDGALWLGSGDGGLFRLTPGCQ